MVSVRYDWGVRFCLPFPWTTLYRAVSVFESLETGIMVGLVVPSVWVAEPLDRVVSAGNRDSMSLKTGIMAGLVVPSVWVAEPLDRVVSVGSRDSTSVKIDTMGSLITVAGATVLFESLVLPKVSRICFESSSEISSNLCG